LIKRIRSWVSFCYIGPAESQKCDRNATNLKNFRKQDLACRNKNPPTIFDVNSQKTAGLCSDDENFAGGHKKSAATLKYKMERSEILAG